MMYKNFKEKMKYFQSSSSSSSAMKLKPIFELEHYLGIESGFVHDRESNTMAIICIEQTILLAFETREILLQWQTKLQEHFCKERHFIVQVVNVPNNGHNTITSNHHHHQNKIKCGSARLLLQDSIFCLVTGIPPSLMCYWSIKQLRRFGLIDGKFCFEGGSQCGKGIGLHILYTSEPEELIRCFDLASNDQLNSFESSMSKSDSISHYSGGSGGGGGNNNGFIHKQRSVPSSDSSTGDSSSQLLSSCFGDVDTLSANYYCGGVGADGSMITVKNPEFYHSTMNLTTINNKQYTLSPSSSLNNNNNILTTKCSSSFSSNTIGRFSNLTSSSKLTGSNNVQNNLIECCHHHHHNHHHAHNSFVCCHQHPQQQQQQQQRNNRNNENSNLCMISTASTMTLKHSNFNSLNPMNASNIVEDGNSRTIINCDHESSTSYSSIHDVHSLCNNNLQNHRYSTSSSPPITKNNKTTMKIICNSNESNSSLFNSSQMNGTTNAESFNTTTTTTTTLTNGNYTNRLTANSHFHDVGNNDNNNDDSSRMNNIHLNFTTCTNRTTTNDDHNENIHEPIQTTTMSKITNKEIDSHTLLRSHNHHHDSMKDKESIIDHPYHRINFPGIITTNRKTSQTTTTTTNSNAMDNYDIPKNLCMMIMMKNDDDGEKQQNNVCVCNNNNNNNINGHDVDDKQPSLHNHHDVDDGTNMTKKKICSSSLNGCCRFCYYYSCCCCCCCRGSKCSTAAATTSTTKAENSGCFCNNNNNNSSSSLHCDGFYGQKSVYDRFLKNDQPTTMQSPVNCFHNGITYETTATAAVSTNSSSIHNDGGGGSSSGYATIVKSSCNQSNHHHHQQQQQQHRIYNETVNSSSSYFRLKKPQEINYENINFINSMKYYENMCFDNNDGKMITIATHHTSLNQTSDNNDDDDDHHHSSVHDNIHEQRSKEYSKEKDTNDLDENHDDNISSEEKILKENGLLLSKIINDNNSVANKMLTEIVDDRMEQPTNLMVPINIIENQERKQQEKIAAVKNDSSICIMMMVDSNNNNGQHTINVGNEIDSKTNSNRRFNNNQDESKKHSMNEKEEAEKEVKIEKNEKEDNNQNSLNDAPDDDVGENVVQCSKKDEPNNNPSVSLNMDKNKCNEDDNHFDQNDDDHHNISNHDHKVHCSKNKKDDIYSTMIHCSKWNNESNVDDIEIKTFNHDLDSILNERTKKTTILLDTMMADSIIQEFKSPNRNNDELLNGIKAKVQNTTTNDSHINITNLIYSTIPDDDDDNDNLEKHLTFSDSNILNIYERKRSQSINDIVNLMMMTSTTATTLAATSAAAKLNKQTMKRKGNSFECLGQQMELWNLQHQQQQQQRHAFIVPLDHR
ncbi:uncharacterized protein LOC124496843 isoform X2 [Dermatophagoides farinae]